MLVRQFLIMLWITSVTLLIAAACTPGTGSETDAIESSSAAETTPSQVETAGEGVVVDVTPMSDAEVEDQPPGQSEPGAGAATEEPRVDSDAPDEQLQPETMAVYAGSTYNFKVDYPSDFVFRTQPAEKLAQLDPMPAASFIFMNPVMASSDLADIEPADLEIRVYEVGQVDSLDSWLTSVGLLQGNNATPFQTANVSGVELCASPMIAPGCSYFVMGNGLVYQLTPATLEGESMVNTFMLVP